MHVSLKLWHLLAPIFHFFPWLLPDLSLTTQIPWLFSSFPWPVGTLYRYWQKLMTNNWVYHQSLKRPAQPAYIHIRTGTYMLRADQAISEFRKWQPSTIGANGGHVETVFKSWTWLPFEPNRFRNFPIPEMHRNSTSAGSGFRKMNTNMYSTLHKWIFKSVVHFSRNRNQ